MALRRAGAPSKGKSVALTSPKGVGGSASPLMPPGAGPASETSGTAASGGGAAAAVTFPLRPGMHGSGALGKRSPPTVKSAEEKEAERRERQEREQREADERAEAERLAEEERIRAEEALRNKPPSRPPSPAPEALQLPVQVFMWMRDRAPAAAGRDVHPSTDRKSVVVPPAAAKGLLEGPMVLAIVRGYLPRSDEQRTLRGAASLTTAPSTFVPSKSTAPASTLGPSTSIASTTKGGVSGGGGPKVHRALTVTLSFVSSAASSTGGGAAEATSLPPTDAAESDVVVPPWPPGKFAAMEHRYDQWNKIRLGCRTLGLDVTSALVHEIADECRVDSLSYFLEAFHSCVRRADALRRQYSKALVAEAAAPTPTHAAELHKAPPPSHVELVERKLLQTVVLEGRRAAQAAAAAQQQHQPVATDLATVVGDDTHLHSEIPPMPSAAVGDSENDGEARGAAEEAATTPMARSGDHAAASAAASTKVFATVATQTVGRCVIVFDDPRDDPTHSGAAPPGPASSKPDAADGASSVPTTVPPAMPMAPAPTETEARSGHDVSGASQQQLQPQPPGDAPPPLPASIDPSGADIVVAATDTKAEAPNDEDRVGGDTAPSGVTAASPVEASSEIDADAAPAPMETATSAEPAGDVTPSGEAGAPAADAPGDDVTAIEEAAPQTTSDGA